MEPCSNKHSKISNKCNLPRAKFKNCRRTSLFTSTRPTQWSTINTKCREALKRWDKVILTRGSVTLTRMPRWPRAWESANLSPIHSSSRAWLLKSSCNRLCMNSSPRATFRMAHVAQLSVATTFSILTAKRVYQLKRAASSTFSLTSTAARTTDAQSASTSYKGS